MVIEDPFSAGEELETDGVLIQVQERVCEGSLDLVEATEDAVGEVAFADQVPGLLGGVELGTVGRLQQEPARALQ